MAMSLMSIASLPVPASMIRLLRAFRVIRSVLVQEIRVEEGKGGSEEAREEKRTVSKERKTGRAGKGKAERVQKGECEQGSEGGNLGGRERSD